jgi:membrane dipeptidase
MLPFSYFDAHCDTLSRCIDQGWSLAVNAGQSDLFRGSKFRHYAQLYAVFHDGAKPPKDGMFAECVRQLNFFLQQMQQNRAHVVQCLTPVDFVRAASAHKTAAMLSIEGAELLECDPARLDYACEMGVKLINITWNRANALSGTNIEEKNRGLSAQGRDFVRRAQELDILMDVSHLSDPGFWDLIDITEKPIVASHSNSRALCDHPRNLTDDMFCAIRDNGGFVGINFYSPFVGLDNSVDAIFAHLEHFLDLGGEDTVGFGGDWDGCDQMPRGIHSIQDMGLIYEEMLRRNYSQVLIDALLYNNLKHTVFGR